MKNREGSFKEKLLDKGTLKSEASILFPILQELKEALSTKQISEAEFTALYILNYQLTRTPKNSLQGISRKISLQNNLKALELTLKEFLINKNLSLTLNHILQSREDNLLKLSLYEIFELNFKGLPRKMNHAILHWLKGSWSIKLFFHIPSALEILALQKNGSRCVSALTSLNSLSNHILDKRDALSFVVHDLEHAVNFFQVENLRDGQIGFYHFIDQLLKEEWVKNLIANTTSDKKELIHQLDYVIADMNAYSVHLLKYLYGILKKFHHAVFQNDNKLELHWNQFIFKLTLPAELTDALINIQNPRLEDEKCELIHTWFVSLGSQSHQICDSALHESHALV